MPDKYRIIFAYTFLSCLLLASVAIRAQDLPRSERIGRRCLALSAAIASDVQVGRPIDVMLTYSNRLSVSISLPGAFQLGRERPGLVVEIQDEKGKTIASSPGASGSLEGIQLAPNATRSGSVLLPLSLTPKVSGKYMLVMEYQKGALVLGEGYQKEMTVSSGTVAFDVKQDVEALETANSKTQFSSFDAWLAAVLAEHGQQRGALLRASLATPGSRGFMIRAISDPSTPPELRLQIAEHVKGEDFPYNANLVALVRSEDDTSQAIISTLEVLPWMQSHGGVSAASLLAPRVELLGQATNLEYRLSVISAAARAGVLTAQRLKSLAEELADPHDKLLILSLLLAKGEISIAETMAEELKGNKTPIRRTRVESFLKMGDERLVGDVAQKYLHLIRMLREESPQ